MKLFYWLRAFIVSVEALVVVVAITTWRCFRDELQAISVQIVIHEDLKKYFMVVPVGLLIWTINEARLLLSEDRESTRVLVAWPDYWRLKTHVSVSLVFGFLFAVASLLPWLTSMGIQTVDGLLTYVASAVGQLTVVISIYWARIRVRELIYQLST